MPSDTEPTEIVAKPALTREREYLELILADFSPEGYAASGGFISRLQSVVDELKAMRKEAAIDYIDQHGPFMVGETRVYTGIKLTTRCRGSGRRGHAA
jgi:hypothetical protein